MAYLRIVAVQTSIVCHSCMCFVYTMHVLVYLALMTIYLKA